jgi:hypothetical protein
MPSHTFGTKNGLVFEFYFFLDGAKWVGTNLVLVQQLPNHICITNVEVIKGIGNGLKFKEIKC